MFVHAGLDDTHFVKVAYHEGLVPADKWLRVQDRKSHQSKFPTNGKAMNSWLVGMVKCACCGYAMHFNHCANRKGVVYHRFIDYGKFTLNGCPTPPIQLKPRQVEDAVLKEMQKRFGVGLAVLTLCDLELFDTLLYFFQYSVLDLSRL